METRGATTRSKPPGCAAAPPAPRTTRFSVASNPATRTAAVTAASRAPTGRSNMPTTAVGGSAGCVITRASSAAGLGSSTGAVGVGAGMAASSLDRCGTGGRGGATGSRAALGLGGAIVASRWMCGVMSESGGGVNLIAVAVLMKVIDWCRGAGVEVTRAPTPTITTIAARCTPALATIPVFGRRSRGAAANSRSMQRDTPWARLLP